MLKSVHKLLMKRHPWQASTNTLATCLLEEISFSILPLGRQLSLQPPFWHLFAFEYALLAVIAF